MLRRAHLMLNKVGLLAALLFALVAVLPATAAVACADTAPASAASAAPVSAPCEDPACEHCAIVCGHGCCHAPHAASPHTSAPLLGRPGDRHAAPRWASLPFAPLQAAYGLERPPKV